MGPKYEFTRDIKLVNGHLLHRIKQLSTDILGGWIEKESNLSQDGDCWVGGNACVYEDAQVYGNAKVNYEVYNENINNTTKSNNTVSSEAVENFIYRVNDSNKLTVRTGYNSIDEFFDEPVTNDLELDTLVICTIDTRQPIVKIQKTKTKDKTAFKFIVDITSGQGERFMFESIISSQEHLNQLIQQTIDALKNYPQFVKYTDDLSNCIL